MSDDLVQANKIEELKGQLDKALRDHYKLGCRLETAERERDDFYRQLTNLTTLHAGTVAIADMRLAQLNDAERELFQLRASLAEARALLVAIKKETHNFRTGEVLWSGADGWGPLSTQVKRFLAARKPRRLAER